jgi:hypothetical protein
MLESLLLFVASLVAGFFALTAFLLAQRTGSAVQEVEALILALISAVLFTGTAIVGRLAALQAELRRAAAGDEAPAWWGRRKH